MLILWLKREKKDECVFLITTPALSYGLPSKLPSRVIGTWKTSSPALCTNKQTNKQSKDLFSGGRILWELSNYFRLGIWGRIFVLRRGRIFQKKELVMVFPAKFEIILADKPQKTPSSQFQAADQPGWVFLLKFGEVFYLLFQFCMFGYLYGTESAKQGVLKFETLAPPDIQFW